MDFVGVFQSFGLSALGYIVPFLAVLTIVVFFHELGHFLVARWCGVAVKVFSVGFGPELIGFNDRRGTRWKLSAVPLGGYVKFLGDDNEASVADRAALESLPEADRSKAFANKGVAARAAIVAAGPLANFVLAIVIFTAIFSIYGRQVTEARVDSIVAGSAAERAGFVAGDVVRSIDGAEIGSFSDLQRIVGTSAGRELVVVVERAGSSVTLAATPDRDDSGVGRLGIQRNTNPENVFVETFSVPQAFVLALDRTWFVIDTTMSYIGKLITLQELPKQLGGPIKIAQISGEVAALGILPLFELAAFLSISIGLVNLFPIPVLDGGHLLFYLVEAISGKPLPERVQEIGFRLGFAALLMLMIFTVLNDTHQWWG